MYKLTDYIPNISSVVTDSLVRSFIDQLSNKLGIDEEALVIGSLPDTEDANIYNNINRIRRSAIADCVLKYKYTDNPNINKAYMLNVTTGNRPPLISNGKSFRVTTIPSYTTIEVRVAIKAKDKSYIEELTNRLKIMVVKGENISKFKGLCRYHLPIKTINVLKGIHENYNKLMEKSTTIDEWLAPLSTDNLTYSSDIAGGHISLVVTETISDMVGSFENSSYGIRYDKEQRYYVVNLECKLEVSRPTYMILDYGLLQYNSTLSKDLLLYAKPLITKGLTLDKTQQLESWFKGFHIKKLYTEYKCIKIPKEDIYIDYTYNPGVNIVSVLVTVDKRTNLLFNIGNDIQYLDWLLVEFLKLEHEYATIKMNSLFDIRLYVNGVSEHSLELDADLNLYSKQPLNPESTNRVIISMNTDSTSLPRDAMRRFQLFLEQNMPLALIGLSQDSNNGIISSNVITTWEELIESVFLMYFTDPLYTYHEYDGIPFNKLVSRYYSSVLVEHGYGLSDIKMVEVYGKAYRLYMRDDTMFSIVHNRRSPVVVIKSEANNHVTVTINRSTTYVKTDTGIDIYSSGKHVYTCDEFVECDNKLRHLTPIIEALSAPDINRRNDKTVLKSTVIGLSTK